MDLDAALTRFDTVEANLRRLEAVWDEMGTIIPAGVSFTDGTDPDSERYRELVRGYQAIVKSLPPIDGYVIRATPWNLNDIGQARFDAMDLGELGATLSVEDEVQAPGREIEEYRAKLNQARRGLVRNELTRLVAEVDGLLPRLSERVGADGLPTADPDWGVLVATFGQIGRLVGRMFKRRARWGDMRRHLSFGENHDLSDIVRLDWPSVRAEIEKNLYSALEPLPVDVGDLGALVLTRPSGPVTTKLKWDVLSDEDFERLLFNLVADADDYANPQWLMHTNAPDQGRDISVEWISSDTLNGPRHRRVIIQAKHWQRKSIRPTDISEALTQVLLWEPPRIHTLVMATSGRFTADAVRWVEQHNEAGKQPVIAMWPESHLELLLAERAHLVAEFQLR